MPDLDNGEVSCQIEYPEIREKLNLNQAVIEILGKDQSSLSVEWLQPTLWFNFASITTESRGGNHKKYCLKCATGEIGRSMLYGEYQGMLEIHKTVPTLTPRPYGYGRFYQDEVETFFFLSDFIEISKGLPNPEGLSKCIATLQRHSVSPTGKFGFFVTTFHGRIPQHVAWDSSWTSFYMKLLKSALQNDLETNGSSPGFEEISSRVLDKVVPRLLGALESGGRCIRPVLTHGDLWEGNIATEKCTENIFLIDAGAYYAHSEMEIGMWRCKRHEIQDERFKNAYLEEIPKSEPEDEWDDRNRLYCVKMNVMHSAHHRGARERKIAFEDMCYLVDKHAPYAENELGQAGMTEQFSRAVQEAKTH